MHNMFRVVWTSRLFCLKHTTRVKTTVDCVVLFFLRWGCVRYWFVIWRYWFVHVLPAEDSSVFKQSGKGSYAIRAQNQLDGKTTREKNLYLKSFRPLVLWNQQSSLRKTELGWACICNKCQKTLKGLNVSLICVYVCTRLASKCWLRANAGNTQSYSTCVETGTKTLPIFTQPLTNLLFFTEFLDFDVWQWI